VCQYKNTAKPGLCSIGCNEFYNRRQNCEGFTLLEILIVVSILAILLVVAAPAYSYWIDEKRAHSRTASFASYLVNARAKALFLGGRVRICGTNDTEQCGTSFDDGWLVFHDLNDDGVVDADEQIIEVYLDKYKNNPITAIDSNGNSVNSISFNFRGFVPNSVNFTISAKSNNKIVSLSKSGRVNWE